MKNRIQQAVFGNDRENSSRVTLRWLAFEQGRMIKTLAESGNSSYRETLVMIEKNTSSERIRKYARKYAGYL